MSSQGWQTVTHNKPKKVKQDTYNFDPIPYRQKEQQDKKIKNNANLNISNNPNQDWNYISINNGTNKQLTNKKFIKPQQTMSAVKTNESGDIIQIKKVSHQMAQSVINARIAKKWTQIQLAHNSTVDVKTISEVEKGGGLYNAEIFNKLSRTLGINIERNYILEKKG